MSYSFVEMATTGGTVHLIDENESILRKYFVSIYGYLDKAKEVKKDIVCICYSKK